MAEDLEGSKPSLEEGATENSWTESVERQSTSDKVTPSGKATEAGEAPIVRATRPPRRRSRSRSKSGPREGDRTSQEMSETEPASSSNTKDDASFLGDGPTSTPLSNGRESIKPIEVNAKSPSRVPPVSPSALRPTVSPGETVDTESHKAGYLARFKHPVAPDNESAPPAGREENQANSSQQTPNASPKRRRRAIRSKHDRAATSSGPVEYRVEGQIADAIDADLSSQRRMNQRSGRQRKGRAVGRYTMCVQVRDDVTQIAILEGRTLIEHYVSRSSDDQYNIDGNIYLGRVTNVLPGMEAAFVDIGTSKNAVLYRGDVRFERDDLEGDDRSVRIEQLLRPKQTVVCQVTKNPIGAKGARLTQEVSLPGRFVVLIPNSDSYGISKRLPDEERRRLRKILDDLRPEGYGIILRTAAEGASADELRRDLDRLRLMWEQIEDRAKFAHAPALLYREPGVAVRVIREEFSRNYRAIVIDDASLYDEVVGYVSAISPELADRVEHYDKVERGLAVFEQFHVHEQLQKALARKVWLPSGGSIVIDHAEALTVIDVNTGKNVGTVSLEETIHKNNLEAVEEIARQLRLRDIGGIIVIDFIDMLIKENREDVMRAFRAALGRDKTKSHVYEMSALGLVEMTRQRVSEGLVEAFSQACPTCVGRGIIFDDILL